MEILRHSYARSRLASSSTSDLRKGQPVSKLIIIQARFQQKQLQEKEEKLLRLYEEQQERAMNRVGSRVQSGGSSVSSTSSVGRGGKVRHMFQARRGTSESRQGRDRSYPLDPISPKANLPVRTQSLEVVHGSKQKRIPGSWSNVPLRAHGGASLSRNNSDLQSHRLDDYYGEYDGEVDFYQEPDRPHRGSIRRTQSQSRPPKSKLLYFGGSHTDLRFSDELDYVQTFHVIDDHYEIPDRDLTKKKDRFADSHLRVKDDDIFFSNFNDKRQFYENRLKCENEAVSGNGEVYQRLPNVGGNKVFGMSQRKEPEPMRTPRTKTFVSQKAFTEKPHLGVKKSDTGACATRDVISPPSRTAANATAAPTITAKTRKTTPTPAKTMAAPKPSVLQTRRTQVPIRQTVKREGTPPVPANRTTVARAPSTMPSSERPPIARKTPARPSNQGSTTRANPQRDLPSCEFCGRHFVEDRISKHQEICRKSSRTKRKPFDSVKQRVKGTEAEQFLKGGKLRVQSQKKIAPPPKDWRKTHEDFINSIRAAREYQSSTMQKRKPSSTRPSASRY